MHTRSLIFVLAITALGFVAPLALGNEEAFLPRSSVTFTTETPPAGISLDFPGGTIAQLAAALISSGTDFSLVGEPGDLAAALPPLYVRNVNTFAFAQTLDSLLRADGLTLGGDWSSHLLTVEKRPPEPKNGPPTVTQSCQLSQELKVQSINAILYSIRVAWALDPSHVPYKLRLQFDPATQLLLISGPPESVRISLNVIRHLTVPPAPEETFERLPPALANN
jgi:hypothetical protein